MTIEVSEQAAAFIRALPPEPRRRIRLALRAAGNGRASLKALEGELSGYWRLRVGSYRLILWLRPSVIQCVFAERRSIVYEIFAEELRRRLSDR